MEFKGKIRKYHQPFIAHIGIVFNEIFRCKLRHCRLVPEFMIKLPYKGVAFVNNSMRQITE